jgi:hypothetical protein
MGTRLAFCQVARKQKRIDRQHIAGQNTFSRVGTRSSILRHRKNRKFDRKAFGATMKGLTLTPAAAPGILMEASWDQNGDIDRASFLAEIVDGKQKIVETLPKLKPSKAD